MHEDLLDLGSGYLASHWRRIMGYFVQAMGYLKVQGPVNFGLFGFPGKQHNPYISPYSTPRTFEVDSSTHPVGLPALAWSLAAESRENGQTP